MKFGTNETGSQERAQQGNSTSGPSGMQSLGSILVESGRLSQQNAERVLQSQQGTNVLFGDAAVQMKLVTQEDVRHALARQFDYSYLPSNDQSLSQDLVAAYRPFSPAMEQFRALRSQLILRWMQTGTRRRSLAVVSPAAGEGRSYIAANLAVVFSQLGERTLLIDADLRNPSQQRMFKLDHGQGLSGLLAGRAGLEAIVRIGAMRDLSILPAGPMPPNPQELLGRPEFTQLLETAQQEFDVVIIDTPPANDYSDAQNLAARAGNALLVARKDRTLAAQAVSLSAQLQQFGTRVMGSVLNEV
jgi:protein-tyrosine kinase